jgi:hypothetical protein
MIYKWHKLNFVKLKAVSLQTRFHRVKEMNLLDKGTVPDVFNVL